MENEAAACLLLASLLGYDEEGKGRGSTWLWIKRREKEGMYASLVQ